MAKLRVRLYAGACAALCLMAMPVFGAESTPDIEWRHPSQDLQSSKYSPAAQIDKTNAKDLKIAWRFKLTEADAIAAPNTDLNSSRQRSVEGTPLMFDGKVYITTGLCVVAAIDPATGKLLWSFDPRAYDKPRGPHFGPRTRGIESWTDGKESRLIHATSGLQLMAIDPKTGKPVEGWGEEPGSWTDLSKNVGRDYDRDEYGIDSPVVVVGDTIVAGSIVNDYSSSLTLPPGHVRGYDVKTGKFKWRFNTIPTEGEFGNETWENGSWAVAGSANVWTMMSADPDLGYVYLPISTPTNDYYGGQRLGDNLFAESLVCLDAATGKRVWHFQTTHHGLWDYDLPAPSNLMDITVDGQRIKAVAQVSKQGFTYVFDRVTGKPVWPIEERPVPQSKVPGERTSPTQPFPTKPPAFEPQGVTKENVIDLSPELKAEALKNLEAFGESPLYTPPGLGGGTMQLPGATGGSNWQGASIDPDTGFLYVQSVTNAGGTGVRPGNPDGRLFVSGGGGGARGPQGLPLIKPPYGRITAYDLNKGEIAWQIPLGDSYRDNPIIQQLKPGPLGSNYRMGMGGDGTLTTKNLVFSTQDFNGASGGGRGRGGAARGGRRGARGGAAEEDASGSQDESIDIARGLAATADAAPPASHLGFLRAFDKKTGELAAEIKLDKYPMTPPMTYVHDGKQYIVFCVVGAGYRDPEYVAYALP